MADTDSENGSSTAKSENMSDSRKRPLDSDMDNGHIKRSNYGNAENTFHFKMLVPSVAAGAIIGKGGETIAQLQKDVGAKVKMSKANDFYPGTNERVCLITGSVESILKVFNFIKEKIKEKPDLNARSGDYDNKMHAEREKQDKLLVPNSTAGMIIGKAGAFIKKIKEESGSYVQLSQKAKDTTLAERCVTIIGDPDRNNLKAVEMILDKIVEDPQSCSCLNVSYADVTGPVANFNPTGSPFAATNGGPIGGSLPPSPNSSHPPPPPGGGGGGLGFGLNLNLTLNFNPNGPGGNSLSPGVVAPLMDHIRSMLRGTGLSEQSLHEISGALHTLASYGFLGLGVGGMSQGNHPMFGDHGSGGNFHSSGGSGFGHGPRPFDRFSGMHNDFGDPFRRSPSGMHSPNGPLSMNSSFGMGGGGGGNYRKSPTPSDQNIHKSEMTVNENLVGAVLGPGGRSLVEIQHISGAMVQISKKGNFAPGTRNRVVTISGTTNAVNNAKFLIEQRVQNEESKRARLNSMDMQ